MTSAKRKKAEAYPVSEEPKPAPNWAPDGCPPNVVKLIEDEQYLEDLGLRGLASSDSAELHQAVRNLQKQLGRAFREGSKVRGWGWRRAKYDLLLLGLGWLLGALCGAALLAAFGP